MKICVVQARPVKGDITANIENHKKLIDLAISHGAGTIIFPELSLTGYEPTLAEALATGKDDSRLAIFQQISDAKQVTIGVGMPTISDSGIHISMILLQSHQPAQSYSKQYLHEDEYPYFVAGRQQTFLTGNGHKIAIAICYELSVPAHAEHAGKNGANVYIASVAKTAAGVETAAAILSGIAEKYAMTVLLSNSVGPCDGVESGGKTAIWNNKGSLLAQLDDSNEGILIIDTDTQELFEKQYK